MGKVNVLRTSGLVLDWDGRTTDRSRNHHTLTNHNAVPVRGKYGKGMLFNGSDAYIDCGNESSLDITDAITIEAWLKPEGDTIRWIVEKTKKYALEINGSGVANAFLNDALKASGGIAPNGQWSHIVTTYNRINSIMYVNGVNVNSVNYTASIGISAAGIYIGRQLTGSPYYFNGVIDKVRIYNRALSAAEIVAHYKSRGYLSGLVESPVKIV